MVFHDKVVAQVSEVIGRQARDCDSEDSELQDFIYVGVVVLVE